MSQVRKLLQGKLIPKAQEGYKFHLDSQDYIVTDEQLKEIDNLISTLDPTHRRFLGNWTNAIKEGNSKGNRASNTVSENMLTNVGGKDKERLKKQKGSFWETVGEKDSYYAKEAIGEALSITASVLNRTVPKKDANSSKKSVAKTEVKLDFNEENGKKYLSPINYEAKKRVSDIIAHLQAGDASEYDYSGYDLDSIKAWLNEQEGDDKYKAGNAYFDSLWSTMSDRKNGYKYNPDTEDLLKLFGINYNFAAPTKPAGGGSTSSSTSRVPSAYTPTVPTNTQGDVTYKVGDVFDFGDKTYKITGVDTDGEFIIEEVTNAEESEEINSQEGQPESVEEQQTPYVHKLVLIKPGDRDDMDWGVYYNGIPYAYESIQPGSDLGNIMAQFEANNKMLWSQGKRYNENSSFTLPSREKISMTLPSIKNFADWTVGQILDDGTDLNQFFLERGITSAALSHTATSPNGIRYFKYYNNFDPTGTYIPREGNTPKETPWGIRSPYYLMIDKDGNVSALTSEPTHADYKENIVNTAPKFKDLYNPTTSAWSRIEPRYPYDNTYFRSHSDRIPATEIGTIYIGKDKYRLYKRSDGRLYLDGPKGKDAYFTETGLYNFIKNAKQRHKEGGIISKSKTDSFKSKFKNVIKGQNGIDPNWKVPGWQIEEPTPTWKQGSLYPNQSKTSVSPWPEGYNPNEKWDELTIKADALSQKVDASIRANYNGYNPYWVPGGVLSTEKDQEEVGGYPKNIPGYYKYLIPALSLARFGLNAHFQNKYRKQAVDALNAGRFGEIAAWANLPRQDSPALDRALQQIRSERMTGIKPVTSDLIANSALQNEREAKLYDRENDIIGRQSQFQSEAAKEALDIMNHNIANQVAIANSNRARNASIDSAIKQQDMILTQRRAQSWENLGLEIQNNLKKDRDIMLNYDKAQEQTRLQKEYDRTIDQIFGSQARNEYNALSADEAANYTDYDDYLNKKYNSIYRQNIETINKAQEARVNKMRKWLYLNGLNHSYPTFITGKRSPYGYKKGGYLRGSTRYTLEPDERIWIDNNKATHQAIAKLSDNTIKLLLRALK